MTSSHKIPHPLEALLQVDIHNKGPLRFDRYMELALYHPEFGYYRQKRHRVGKSEGTDFYTASTLANGFTSLLAGALKERLGSDISRYTLIEWGTEGGGLPWEDHDLNVREILRIPLGEDPMFPSPAIHFSNELFDAQPFRRFVFAKGRWMELFVDWNPQTEEFVEAPRTPDPLSINSFPSPLPESQAEGYCIDLPTGANTLLRKIVEPSWEGLFVAFDYGRTWENLLTETPQGTLRGYHRHAQVHGLYKSPGEIDLTGHICWDSMEYILKEYGFQEIQCERQESFFVKNAPKTLKQVLTSCHNPLDPLRREVAALLHPSHFGQAFQVLTAVRKTMPKNSPNHSSTFTSDT
ncbi:MAG: SAM-dependent methyltransferase [Opitutales bacterium]|nr:SAM-dependent methyltransferase [Opitutales bacterium]MCH8540906.1 SAM-dependent methyltransferase [Opitutales bacterium]